jgi:hypothetical protein
VGTATFADPRAGADVLAGLTRWCAAEGVRRIGDVVGAVRGQAPPPDQPPPREQEPVEGSAVEQAPVEQAPVEHERIEERR